MVSTRIKDNNADVNSGEWLVFPATDLNYKLSCFTSTRPIPHTDTTLSFENRLSKGYSTGYDNPTGTLKFYIDIASTHETGSLANIDFEWLKELVKYSHNTFTLRDETFRTSSNTYGDINIMIKDIDIKRSNDSVKTDSSGNVIVGNWVDVSISFVEVKV